VCRSGDRFLDAFFLQRTIRARKMQCGFVRHWRAAAVTAPHLLTGVS